MTKKKHRQSLIYTPKKNIENFNPLLDYSRVYPGTFSYKYGYGTYYRPYNNKLHNNNIIPYNKRYNAGYRDYHYIPAHEYLNNWMNGNKGIPDSCINPAKISEYCVNNKLNNNIDIGNTIESCITPMSISESCPSLNDWKGPITYINNDKINFIP
jgi:hypothetical protein